MYGNNWIRDVNNDISRRGAINSRQTGGGTSHDFIPGVNVGNAFKQVGSYVGLAPKGDYDIFDNYTISGRAGQTQIENYGDQSGSQTVKSTYRDPYVNSDPRNNNYSGGYSGGYSRPKTLDRAGLASLDSRLADLDIRRDKNRQSAAIKKSTAYNKKEDEYKREENKYKGKKTASIQNFGSAVTENDINTRDTLDSLVNSLSTMGMGGSRDLARQILTAANQANRKANATQARDNMELDTAFNDYKYGYQDDLAKINDQYNYDLSQVDKNYGQEKQNLLQKKADIYGNADMTNERSNLMSEADNLNSFISNSTFLNPEYTGKARAMATPELSDYAQNMASYDTTGVASNDMGTNPQQPAGNLAIKAAAISDKDFGVKKKYENQLGYGV